MPILPILQYKTGRSQLVALPFYHNGSLPQCSIDDKCCARNRKNLTFILRAVGWQTILVRPAYTFHRGMGATWVENLPGS